VDGRETEYENINNAVTGIHVVIVMAKGYYELSAAEQWQDYPKNNSYSDTRYRIQ